MRPGSPTPCSTARRPCRPCRRARTSSSSSTRKASRGANPPRAARARPRTCAARRRPARDPRRRRLPRRPCRRWARPSPRMRRTKSRSPTSRPRQPARRRRCAAVPRRASPTRAGNEMSISAETVKTLRARTGAGMMECKKALLETGGDLDAAAEIMRKAGLTKADKKADRIAADGAIATALSGDGRAAVLAEVNCETDFVTRQPEFQAFAADVARAALAASATRPEALAARKLAGGASVDETRRNLVAKIGEKIDVRRAAVLRAPDCIGAYVLGTRIGTLVGMKGGDEALARDLAMHVAAANPRYVSPSDVPADVVAKEREILAAQAAAEGKPAAIVEKMVEGRLRKYLAEICLTGQPFVKDPDTSVGQLLERAKASVSGFLRYEVGEGIERKQENFAAEVMAQVEAAKDKGKPDKPS